MNIRTSDFSCINQDKTIRGVEYLPAGEKLPAVIMSHGFGGCQAELTDWAERLAKKGKRVWRSTRMISAAVAAESVTEIRRI